MRRPALSALATVLCAVCGWVSAPARADVVVLKDGTRVEGDLQRTEDGYNLTTPAGIRTRLKTADIKSIEVKPRAAPDDAQRRLDSLRRSLENASDANLAVTRYNDFLRRYGDTDQAEPARADLAQWQERVDRHMTRAGGRWVTPEELGSLKEDSQEAAVKAASMVSQGRLREAGPLLQQALEMDPKNPSALYLRGVVLFRQDQLGPSRKAFEQTAQLVPEHAATLNNIAVIFWRQKNEAAALRSYDAALLATGPAAGVSGPEAEAVVNNVAEALHALPKELRDAAATKKVVLHFQEREAALAAKMKQRGFYRFGAAWVEGDQLDKLLAQEKEIDNKIKDLEAEFDGVQQRIEAIDRDIADTERSMRRMEATGYVRDPVTGRVGRLAPPRMYYGLQRDLEDLKRERATQESKVAALRRDAKAAKQQLPVQRYTGTQRIIDADGAPLMGAAAPAPPPAPAAGKLPSVEGGDGADRQPAPAGGGSRR